MRLAVSLNVLLLAMSACNKAPPAAPTAPTAPAAPAAPANPEPAGADSPATPPSAGAKPAAGHGDRAPLGTLTVSGWTFELTRVGALVAGHEAAIEARVTTSPAGRDWTSVGAYLWVEDAAGNPVTTPSKPVIENGQLHFHASVQAGAAAPAAVVVRVREGGQDARERLALAGGPAAAPAEGAKQGAVPAHTHEKTPHDGLITAWTTGGDAALSGFAEIKLHDDKGDVEVWQASDRAMTQPVRLPVTARPTITLVDLKGRTITLAPRDTVDNKDEDGTPHLVQGASGPETGYFIFPGSSGEDATALQGKTFSSIAILRFDLGGRAVTSEELLLQPHTHGPGGHH